MPTGRTASVVFLGNDQALNATLARIEAKLKALSDTADEQNAKMAASSEAAGVKIGRAYEEGTTKAAASLRGLSKIGGDLGVPLSGSLSSVGKHLDETTAKTTKLHDTLANLGKVTVMGGLAGFAAAAYEGVKGATALQTAMEQLHTQAHASQAEVTRMTKAVMDMSGSLATSPQALADSLYHVESAGFRGAQALNIMTIAAKEAKISGADLTDTTTALTAAVFSGIKGAQDATQAMGLLNATVGAGDMKFQNLNEAFAGPMLATVKGYGLSLKDVGAALATFGDLNIRGADAATQLRMAVQYMAKPAATAGPLLAKLGLNVHSFADAMANGGLMPALQLLHDKLQAAGIQGNQMAQVIGDLFTKKGAAGVTILENSIDKLDSKYKVMGSSTNQVNTGWAAWNKTLAADMDHLRATVQGLADKFGMYLIPKLQATASAISDVVSWLGKHKQAAEDLAGVIVGVLGAAVAAFAYTKAVAFIGAIGSMGKALLGLGATSEVAAGEVDAALSSTGVGAVIVALGIAAGELGTHWSQVMSGMSNAAKAMENAVRGALNVVINVLNSAISAFNATVGQITGSIGQIGQLTSSGGSTSSTYSTGGASSIGIADTRYGAVSVNTNRAGKPNLPLQLPGGSTAMQIANYLKTQGFSNVAIAGILGNFAQETGGGSLSGINTRDSGTGASGMGGMGIAQWTANRRLAEMQLARSEGKSPTDLGVQLQFLIQELRTDYHNAYKAIAGASSPQQAARLFDQIFEGGTDPGGVRERAAAQAYAMLTGSSGASSGGISTSGLDALLNSTTGPGSKATMRYVGHHPVGRMTEAQWQAYQAAHPATTRSLLYANPLPGMTGVGRTDQGVDYTAQAGSAVNAIGAGIVTAIIQNWYKGQPLIEEQLTQGPNKGKYVYYAEQLKSLVSIGQKVAAGQRIGTVASSGTGLELGFGAPGGKTLAMTTTGYTEGEATPAGKAFAQFMRQIGAHGVYTTTNNLTGAVTGGGSGISATLAQLTQAFETAIQKAGTSLIQKLNDAIQNGTVKTLSNALGLSTTTPIGVRRTTFGTAGLTPRGWGQFTEPLATALNQAFEHLSGTASINQINRAGAGLVAKGLAGSTQDRAYQQEVLQLVATGQTKEAQQLVAAHKAAIQALAQELYAQQVLKDGESLQMQSQKLTDQTTAITNAAQNQLNVTKAQYQLANDMAQAQLTAIRDMTQTITDQFSGMVQSVEDHTQMMSDAANAVVQGINDQTQTQVDILGERGLFGLNLVAQKLQVGLDQQKAADDQQIALATQNVDAVTSSWHQNVANAQIALDQVTAQQDQAAALAQQGADTVAINQAVRLASAQARVDANTLHNDVSVIGPAQTAVDLGATLPKAQQDVLNAQLKRAQGVAGVSEGNMAKWFAGVQDSVNAITNAAQQQAQSASDAANMQIAAANQTLQVVQGEANYQIALAQGTLAAVQGNAAITEAGLQQGVNITQARAQTQFAGSGLQVNVYGIPAEDASAVGNAVSWAMRTQLA